MVEEQQSDERITTACQDIAVIKTKIETIENMIKALFDRPRCVHLRDNNTCDIADTVREHERQIWQAQGAAKGVLWAVGISSGLIGGLLTLLFKWWITK
jgi:hypothetical protein